MDELDPEIIQQIIEMEEKSKKLDLDALLAQQLSSNHDNLDDDMIQVLEQIRLLDSQNSNVQSNIHYSSSTTSQAEI